MTATCPPIQHFKEIKNKICLLRVDLNVPVKDGEILDDSRIDFVIPTINELLDNNNRIILISHFGRPKGEFDEDYSLKFLVEPLIKKLGMKVCFLHNIKERIKDDCRIALLENIRFYKGELDNSSEFAKELSQMGDVYINEAFSVSHRAQASICAIREFMPSYLGPKTEQEIKLLKKAICDPDRPFVAILSGAKVSTKLGVIKGLLNKVEHLLLAGGIANTFLKAQGKEVGESIVENSMLDEARAIIKSNNAKKIVLPTDFVIAPQAHANQNQMIISSDIKPGNAAFDIGPKSIAKFKEIIGKSKTLIWNGPLGMFEVKPFDHATSEIAHYVASISKNNKDDDKNIDRKLFSIIGGGETIAAVKNVGLSLQDFSHASTAGGAFLEFVEGKQLPGLPIDN